MELIGQTTLNKRLKGEHLKTTKTKLDGIDPTAIEAFKKGAKISK